MTTINQPSKAKIEDLLGGIGSRVHIPSYQRTYSWSVDEAKDLYADIVRFQERYPGNKIDNAEYFLGSIVGVKEGKTLRILDGQQRIATITILLSAIRDALVDRNDDYADELQKSLIQERLKPGTALQNRLTLSVYDKDFFSSFIQQFPRNANESVKLSSHRLIVRVRNYCDSALAADLEGKSKAESVDWLVRLWVVIVSCLVLVVVEASTEEDATEIFEVLNERGVGLSTIDLLRNFLLGYASTEDAREQIADEWAGVFAVSDNPAAVQTFLRHYWIAKHGDVKARGLYREIKHSLRKLFDEHASTPLAFSTDLSDAADIYRSLLPAPTTSDHKLNTTLAAIATVGARALYPAILSTIQNYGEKAAHSVAEALLTHYVRWTIIGRKESTELEAHVFRLAKDLSANLTPTAALGRIREFSLSDEDFEAAFAVASLTKPGPRRHILESLENYMRTKSGEDEVAPKPASELHVEHIYPQTPKPGNKLDDHDEWVNRIGNLTLLAKRWNTKIKNEDFATVKLPEISKSVILLNKWIQDQKNWGPTEIQARQEDLAALAAEVWPLPAAQK